MTKFALAYTRTRALDGEPYNFDEEERHLLAYADREGLIVLATSLYDSFFLTEMLIERMRFWGASHLIISDRRHLRTQFAVHKTIEILNRAGITVHITPRIA